MNKQEEFKELLSSALSGNKEVYIENFKYGVDGDYIIYNTLFICENGIYTFATKENFEESEELDYFYVKCKKIEIEEK